MALMHIIFTTSAKLGTITKAKGNMIFVQDTKEIYVDFNSTSRVQVGLDNIPFPSSLPANGGNADTVDGKNASEIMVEKVSDTAELVTLDGLQGGVPFSDITLSGDIVGQEIILRACGKNLIAYPYRYNSGKINGVDFTVNDDGSVTVNGTATANVNFYLCYDKQMNFPAGRYMMSGCPKGGSLSTYRMEAYSYSDDGNK